MPRTADPGLSIAKLENILNSRKAELQSLERDRSKIAKKLAAIDSRIAGLSGQRGRGGSVGSFTGGGRARNAKSLVETLSDVLSDGKPMSVGDIVDAVRKSGYQSSSANFRGIVNQTLIKEKGFGSSSRGMYQLKK